MPYPNQLFRKQKNKTLKNNNRGNTSGTPITIDPPTVYKHLINYSPNKVDKTTNFKRLPLSVQQQYKLNNLISESIPEVQAVSTNNIPYVPEVAALEHSLSYTWDLMQPGDKYQQNWLTKFSFGKANRYYPRTHHKLNWKSPPPNIRKVRGRGLPSPYPKHQPNNFSPPPIHNAFDPECFRLRENSQGTKFHKTNSTSIFCNYTVENQPIAPIGRPLTELEHTYNNLLLNFEELQKTLTKLSYRIDQDQAAKAFHTKYYRDSLFFSRNW